MNADVLELQRKAEIDLACARVLAKTDIEYFAEKICSDCQQSAEKFLKAALLAADVPHTKTHDLPVLLRQLIAFDHASWTLLMPDCEDLSDYLSLRYVGDAADDEALSTLEKAERIAQLATVWIADRT